MHAVFKGPDMPASRAWSIGTNMQQPLMHAVFKGPGMPASHAWSIGSTSRQILAHLNMKSNHPRSRDRKPEDRGEREIHVYMCVCIYIYVYIYMCAHVCIQHTYYVHMWCLQVLCMSGRCYAGKEPFLFLSRKRKDRNRVTGFKHTCMTYMLAKIHACMQTYMHAYTDT